MSRILHLVNMGLRYDRSKGFRETRLDEPLWAIWRSPVTWRRVLRINCPQGYRCFAGSVVNTEENASHHGGYL